MSEGQIGDAGDYEDPTANLDLDEGDESLDNDGLNENHETFGEDGHASESPEDLVSDIGEEPPLPAPEAHSESEEDHMDPQGDVGLDSDPDPKAISADQMTNQLAEMKRDDDVFSEIDLEALDDEDDIMDGAFSTDKKDPNRYVLAKFLGTEGSPMNDHVQHVNGRKAVFPRNKWVFVQQYFISNAKHTGYPQFVKASNGKRKVMRVTPPNFQVQEIPSPMNTKGRILEFKAQLEARKKRSFPLACDTF